VEQFKPVRLLTCFPTAYGFGADGILPMQTNFSATSTAVIPEPYKASI
jgi:hypothetical protein